MNVIKHKIFGLGEIVSKDVIDGRTYITAKFDTSKELRLAVPESFQTGAVEALGSLKDEVDRAIAEKYARLAAVTAPTAAPSAPPKRAAAKTMPSGPLPSAFEKYLISEGYAVVTDSGNPSTVYSYLNAVESIRVDEGVSWDTLKTNIAAIVSKYDVGGAKELVGAKSNKTYINALKRFAEFHGKLYRRKGGCFGTEGVYRQGCDCPKNRRAIFDS